MDSRLRKWSESEHKRSKAVSDKIYSKLRDYESDLYEEDGDEVIEEFELEVPGCKPTTITVYREFLRYASNWDENDRRVTQGKRVPGTTFYTVADDGDVIDENYIGYATKEDAIHAAKLYIQEVRDIFAKYSK